MIYVSSRDDILKLFKKPLGGGEESNVGLLEDGMHVAKAFNQPRDKSETNNLLIGSALKQDSFCFFLDLYANNDFIWGGIANYADGEKVSNKIQEVDFINLLYSTSALKKDIKTISDAGILVGDWKDFNMKFTEHSINVVDTGRFVYSNKDTKEIYRHNLEMIFTVLRFAYSNNPVLKRIFKKKESLEKNFRDNENFPEFFKQLKIYTSEDTGKPVGNFEEYIKLSKK